MAAMDKNLQNELFGSDSDDDDDAPARPSAPTGEEPVDGEEADGDDVGEAELFGSDDSDAEAAPRSIVSAPSAPSAPPLHYELPLLPRPEVGSELYTMRLPNILSIEPRAFDPLTFEDADEEQNTIMGKTDNIIRWRETEEGVRQSNARMVTWSDGSMTLHVGDEVLTAAPQKVEGGNQLFTRHKGSNLECHGLVRKKLVLQPASIKSSTHKALTKRIAKNHVKGSRMQMHTTTIDPEKKKLEDEKTWEQKNRLQARQNARGGQDDYGGEGGEELTTGFLDSDDDVGEGNLGAIKRKFTGKDKKGKRKTSTQPAIRAAFGGKQLRRPGRRDEGSDSSMERDESEEDGDSEEMDGFIVKDDGAKASDSEEEEAEDSDDSEEAKAPKKRGRK